MADRSLGGTVPIPVPVSIGVGRGRRKASLSTSKLADKEAQAVYRLLARIQDYLYLPVPDPMYVCLGAMAANMIKGDPVWLMMVGPPGCGKDTLLKAFLGMPRVYPADTLSSDAALLSGVPKKEYQAGASGGLLRMVGKRGSLVITDFTSTVMGMEPNARKKVLDAFRVIYGGSWFRDVGASGHLRLSWDGKLGFLAGGTVEIDQQQREFSALGERWVYYRFPYTNGTGETIKALRMSDPEEVREVLKGLVKGFYEEIGLGWACGRDCRINHKEHIEEEERGSYTNSQESRFEAMARLVSLIRSHVPRDWYSSGKEVSGVVEPEVQARLGRELAQLWSGMRRIGLEEEECWRLIGDVALSSAPSIRIKLLRLLEENEKAGVTMTMDTLRQVLRVGKGLLERERENLWILGLIRKSDIESKFGLTDLTRDLRLTGWKTN